MSIVLKCDVCGNTEDEEIKVYEISEQVKKECFGDDYDHICKECLTEENEDKSLIVKNGKVVFKNNKGK